MMADLGVTLEGPRPSRPWRRDLPWVALGVAVLALVFWADPATAGIYPRCPWHWLTGWHCPGCGTGRALHQLLHGNLSAAWSLNPAAVIGLPLLAVLVGFDAWRRWTGRALPRALRAPRYTGWGVAILLVAWWILRNVLGLTTA